MTHQRLNHIAVLHIHREELDALDTATILSEFVSASNIRGSIYGHYSLTIDAPYRLACERFHVILIFHVHMSGWHNILKLFFFV